MGGSVASLEAMRREVHPVLSDRGKTGEDSMNLLKNDGKALFRALTALAFFCVAVFCPCTNSTGADDTRIPDRVKIGVLARRGAEECLRSWSPTASYLSSNIPGVFFDIVPLEFHEIAQFIESAKLDFLVLNPSIYSEFETRYGISRLATRKIIVNGNELSRYGGVIFTRADRSDIRSIADLQGKSFAAVDETSLGGWHAAWREMKENGLDPHRHFSRLLFAGTHDAAVLAVLKGGIDAGTASTSILEEMMREGKIAKGDFKVLNEHKYDDFPFLCSTRLYPDWPFAKLKHTPNVLAERVAVALLSMPSNDPAAKASNTRGWTIPLDYRPVEDCLKVLGLDGYAHTQEVSFKVFLRRYLRWLAAGAGILLFMSAAFLYSLRLNRRLTTTAGILKKEVAERRQAEESYRDLNRKNDLILGAVDEGIFGMDLEGRVTLINPAAERMVGWSGDAILGMRHHDAVHHTRTDGSRFPWEECPMQSSLRNGKVVRVAEDVFFHRDGTPLFVEYTGTPIFDNGIPVGVVVTFRDIAERKRAEEDRRENEERIRALFNATTDSAILLAPDGTILALNYVAARRRGAEASDLVGKSLYDTLPADAAQTRRAVMEEVVTSKRSIEFDEHREGRDYAIRIIPVFDPQGAPAQLASFSRDVTESRRAKRELMEREKLFRELADNIPVGLALMKPDAGLEYLNPTFRKIFCYDSDEIPELHDWLAQLIPEGAERSAGFRLDIPAARSESGEVNERNLTARCRDGSEKRIALRSVLMGDGKRLIACEDISETHRLEAQMRRAQKMQAIGTLAGGIAHDFNNILLPIIGYTEMTLHDLPEGSGVRKNLEQVLQSSHRAKELVRRILAFSRLNEQDRQPVRVNLILKEILGLLRATVPASIAFELEIAPRAEDFTVTADPTHIHQIVMNLCANAAHAMHKTGGVLRVALDIVEPDTLDSRKNEGFDSRLRLLISDTGHGMTEEVKQRIFDPYFTTKEPGEGTGLGLAVVYGIIQGYGGSITVESRPNEGSTFQILLPGNYSDDASAPLPEPVRPIVSGSERILLVDDEPDIVAMGKLMLERLQYKVTTVSDAESALKVFAKDPYKFDLVITDQTMPGMSGAQMTSHMLTLRPDLPVILCTGYSDAIDAGLAAIQGIRGFIMKPFVIADMSDMIRNVLGKGEKN